MSVIFTGRENQLKKQIKIFIFALLQICGEIFPLNVFNRQPICTQAFQHFNTLKYILLVPYKLWLKIIFKDILREQEL